MDITRLPPGLTYDPDTNVLSGVPAEQGSVRFTINGEPFIAAQAQPADDYQGKHFASTRRPGWSDWETKNNGTQVSHQHYPTETYCWMCQAIERLKAIEERRLAAPVTLTLSRVDYARFMHLAYAGANLLAEDNGQTPIEPYPENKAWLDGIDKEVGG